MMSAPEATTRRRVKLYILNDKRQWDDKGTGHVSAMFVEGDSMSLVVISETDGSSLLQSRILRDTSYQKQQETLILWSESDNTDLALSFQEKVGCDDIWAKICRVQGKDPSVEITQDVSDDVDELDDNEPDIARSSNEPYSITLPSCELSYLDEIAQIFKESVGLILKSEKLASELERGSFLKELIEVFHQAEENEDVESLHLLYDIARNIIVLNKHALYEIIFADTMLMDIIGMLEYNPLGRNCHRDFLRNQAHFKEVFPLHNPDLVSKIHQTYRVQYIQDCCLPPPSLFEDNTLPALNSFIFINKLDIISSLQEDEQFMRRLFIQLSDKSTEPSRRRDLALFVKEYCALSQNLQPHQKERFFAVLDKHGALRSVEHLLTFNDASLQPIALCILNTFIENQSGIVREFVVREARNCDDNQLLINNMIDQIVNDNDAEHGNGLLISGMLKTLLEQDPTISSFNYDSERAEFLEVFFCRCFNHLCSPLFENTKSDYIHQDDYKSAYVMSQILELVIYLVENHNFQVNTRLTEKNILGRAVVLFDSKHLFLTLTVVRLIRRIIGMKDDCYNRYLVCNDFFKPILNLFFQNGHRYNMLESAILELFDFIRVEEEMILLVVHIIENHWSVLRDVRYVQTFARLKTCYDDHITRVTHMAKAYGSSASFSRLSNKPFHRRMSPCHDSGRWYNQDSDEEIAVNDNNSDNSPIASPPTGHVQSDDEDDPDQDQEDHIASIIVSSTSSPTQCPAASPHTVVSPTTVSLVPVGRLLDRIRWSSSSSGGSDDADTEENEAEDANSSLERGDPDGDEEDKGEDEMEIEPEDGLSSSPELQNSYSDPEDHNLTAEHADDNVSFEEAASAFLAKSEKYSTTGALSPTGITCSDVTDSENCIVEVVSSVTEDSGEFVSYDKEELKSNTSLKRCELDSSADEHSEDQSIMTCKRPRLS